MTAEVPQEAIEAAMDLEREAWGKGADEAGLQLLLAAAYPAIRKEVLAEVETVLRAEGKKMRDEVERHPPPSEGQRFAIRRFQAAADSVLATLQKDEGPSTSEPRCGGTGMFDYERGPHGIATGPCPGCPDCTPEDQESTEGSGAPLVDNSSSDSLPEKCDRLERIADSLPPSALSPTVPSADAAFLRKLADCTPSDSLGGPEVTEQAGAPKPSSGGPRHVMSSRMARASGDDPRTVEAELTHPESKDKGQEDVGEGR